MAAPALPALAERGSRIFPTLTPAQIARVAAHGRERTLALGEVLTAPGEQGGAFHVVATGRLEVVRPTASGEALVAEHGPGSFTGEVAMLAGRPSLVLVRAAEPGVVVEVERERLLALVQTDAELSEIFLRAFVLRRAELVAHGFGDVVLLGSNHCAGTLRVREFLTRNGHPYAFIDLDRDAGVQELLDRFAIAESDVPVLICRCELVLRNPTNREIADALGFNAAIDRTHVRDLVVVGAGPAGLAAAVYGASEGLDVLVLESNAPGGQAGTSSRIENYLGFPTGISGQELAARAFTQAEKFGAQLLVAGDARALRCDRVPYRIDTGDGTEIQARTVIIATGAEYRRLPLDDVPRYEGAGVYYGATYMEAQLCRGEEVVVVGAGNSAGQAAVFLAGHARRVHMLIRSGGLAATMSRYLIRRIEESPAIVMRTHAEIVGLEGDGHLERVRWRDKRTGRDETLAARHVFTMTGATPCTRWLGGCVAIDDRGFIRTGQDLAPEDLADARWPLARRPHLLETSLPGVFAVGDVRAGNVKRVASAVGEGSIAVSFVHQVLAE
jgi:thioredoxin reductase (NADPH)